MSPDRVKCEIYQEMTTWISVCKTHGYRFETHVARTDRCPLGRLEDIETRLDSIEDSIEDSMHAVTKALSERS